MTTIGSLCSGYGGLDLAVEEVFGARTAWHAEIDPDASRVLAHHWPEVPNLGDLTAVDWSAVAPVDVLTAGFPCTDVSCAGRRAGIAPGTRSGVWIDVARAINALRPYLVFIENVRGLLSARAHSVVEPCPWCVGDPPDEHALRALGAVLGDLADIGYDAIWQSVPAAAVGAPHLRWRVFILAWPADAPGPGLEAWRQGRAGRRPAADADGGRIGPHVGPLPARQPDPDGGAAADAEHGGRDGRARVPFGHPLGGAAAAGGSQEAGRAAGVTLLPTPTAQLAVNGGSQHPDKRRDGGHGPTLADQVEHLLPTPRATDGTKGGPGQRGSSGDLMLPSAVAQLLPTPTAMDSHSARNATANRSVPHDPRNHSGWTLSDVAYADRWGEYAPAVARWEAVLGRPAPDPTEAGPRGGRRLAPPFVEWLMGLPSGHVTGHGLPRNAQLRLLGNGVVPQQAAHALRLLLATAEVVA